MRSSLPLWLLLSLALCCLCASALPVEELESAMRELAQRKGSVGSLCFAEFLSLLLTAATTLHSRRAWALPQRKYAGVFRRSFRPSVRDHSGGYKTNISFRFDCCPPGKCLIHHHLQNSRKPR